ncbi:MAG: DNA mismatch repair protein MutS [Defluviitaleaceae bacterium]|nr:DNA mismatch repair protein MutS [Defluviitaleaceae bacterium]
MPGYTPMMEQYFQIKEQNPSCLLFFRLGDFYEMFFDDAVTASRELDIVLTGRDCGKEERAPMCGVPFHAADGYVAKLVDKGYRVAICEQVEDPRIAKGIVRREIVRIVTPGTVTDAKKLDEAKNNFISCVSERNGIIGIASADITTGLFFVSSHPAERANGMLDELARIAPAEIITHETFSRRTSVENHTGLKLTHSPEWTYNPQNALKLLTGHFKTHSLEGFGIESDSPAIPAAGALLHYLRETQKDSIAQITSIKKIKENSYMALDGPSRRSLELTSGSFGRGKNGSLLGALDLTRTAMGARMLRGWVEQPLLNPVEINERLDAVEEWKKNPMPRAELRELLGGIRDIERLISRLAGGYPNGKEMAAFRDSLKNIPHVKTMLAETDAGLHKKIRDDFDGLADIHELIENTLAEDPPFSTKEGGLIKRGFDAWLDELVAAKENGGEWLVELENAERESTGIKNLKIRFNKVFGYYIELTNSYKHLAPERYVRRQTLAGCERFVTEELKRLEESILGAEEKQNDLECELFEALRREVAGHIGRIMKTAGHIACLDSLQSLAEAAEQNFYVKPTVNACGEIVIVNGRHPSVERAAPGTFVPNDTVMDAGKNRLMIITGPNMAGKSTYMRQVALITLMAQIGSFVPADSAKIGVVDRIFTRVGASDDLAMGKSTFMVEMTEVANIVNNATNNSLILLDEIGRGTSTYDGLSLAWAVLEHIADIGKMGAKTLVATHYHELIKLEGLIDGAVNYCFTVRETGDEMVFLRKLMPGASDKSYGLHVAKLAGIPLSIIKRAETVLENIGEINNAEADPYDPPTPFASSAPSDSGPYYELAETLGKIDVERITPIEAMIELENLKKILTNESGFAQ